MHPHAVIRCPDGSEWELVPGDVIGRHHSAALPLDDGRVSEAHAMLSLRDGALRLLGLRGAFSVAGRPLETIVLAPGMRVALARGVEIEVVTVMLPEEVMGIEADGLPPRVLPGVASLRVEPAVRVRKGWDPEAPAQLWSTGEGWRVRTADGARSVDAGDRLTVGQTEFRLLSLPVSGAGGSVTRRGEELSDPLHILAQYDSVHVHRGDRVVLHLGGILARIISELVAMDGPVAWTVLARELWPAERETHRMRSRLDANLARLRRKFRAAGVRVDLVSTDGAGQIELVRYPRDTVEDRS